MFRIVRRRTISAFFYAARGGIDAIGRIVIAIGLLCIGIDADTIDALHDRSIGIFTMGDDDAAIVIGIAIGADINLAAHTGSTDTRLEALFTD